MDTKNIGVGKQHETATEAYDAEHGEHVDSPGEIPEDSRFATGNMPKAPDPSPFALGPMTPGGR